MENQRKRLSNVVGYFKSWIPWRPELRNIWMRSNRWTVCYDCEFQFGFFSPRHHCPFCGRIFCARCSTNLVHPEQVSFHEINNYREKEEHVRVCNFCFEQCKEDGNKDIVVCDEWRDSSPSISPSWSDRNLLYSESTCNRNNTIGCSVRSNGHYQPVCIHSSCDVSSLSPHTKPDKQESFTQTQITDSMSQRGKSSPEKFRYYMHRGQDDDDASVCHPVSEVQYYHQASHYYGLDDYYGVDEFISPEQSIDANLFTSTITEIPEFQVSLSTEKIAKEESDNVYNFTATSPTYNEDGTFSELVDFENNGILWLPPSPANAANEELLSFDDDDGEAAAGEFAYAPSSKSFGSGESHIQHQSRIATKDVVIGHFRALVCQLLQVEDLPMGDEDDKESWLEIITSLSWEVASLLKPDTSRGGGMDPGGYAKIKCLPCGHRSYSSVVKGIVCRKNLAHRRMKSRIEKPRILLLGGTLEYQKVPNHLSSFDTLLQQEMGHLKMAVEKIEAYSPSILLVEKTVSRFAQDHLLAKDISLVLNVKRCLLERISRCTGSAIVPSIDHLSSEKLGTCELFHVEKFCEELSSSGNSRKSLMKNLMFFDGCPKPLGCTVLLMGAHNDELKKVKQILQYGIFAAYHLALETSFLADEGASLPELPFKSNVASALPERPLAFGSTTMPGSSVSCTTNSIERGNKFLSSGPSSLSYNVIDAEMTFQHISFEAHDSPSTGNSSCSICSSNDYKGPAEKDFHNRNFSHLLTSDHFSSPHLFAESDCCDSTSDNYLQDIDSTGNFKVTLGRISDHENENDVIFSTTCNKASEVADVGSCKVLPQVGKKTLGDLFGPYFGSLLEDIAYLQEQESFLKEDSPPSDHQSILVSLSTRCVWKGTVCERAHLFRIKYYGSFDKPLGRFLRDHLFDQYYQCHSCEMPSEAHVHCYTHRQGSLTISVRKISEELAGAEDGKIWMWHSCLRCPREDGKPPQNLRVIMSDAAWGLSFGKFLELSFSNHAAATRVASCGHSLHRDCLRFYGFGQMVACFRYASVQSHSVCLPHPKLHFSTKIQDWIQNEVNEVTDKAEMLFTRVLNAISQISERELKSKSARKKTVFFDSRHYMMNLERMLHEEKFEFEECLYNILKKEGKEGYLFVDVLDINKLHRRLLFHSYLWDQRLIFASRLHINSQEIIHSEAKLVEFFPSRSPGPSSSDSVPLKTRNSEQVASQVDQVGELSRVQSSQDIRCLEREAHQDYICRNSSCTSPGYHFDQSSVVVHRSLSDGQVSLKADLPEALDAKWTGEKTGTFVEFEKLEDNTGIEKDQCLIVSQMTEGDCTAKDISRWSEMPFLTLYQSFFMKVVHNSSFLSGVLNYDPVYVPRFWELDYDHGSRHMFPLGINDTDIPIYDDEPSSIISYALVSSEYEKKLAIERIRLKKSGQSSTSLSLEELGVIQRSTSSEEPSLETLGSVKALDDTRLSLSQSKKSIELNQNFLAKSENIRVSFTYEGRLGKVVYGVTCYCAVHFDVLRKLCCPSELDYVRSLSRCKKWGAQGGKSNVFFAKTLDDRFIIKQVTKTELVSFLDFGAKYFKYVRESISSRNPTCLAKVVGIYQIMTHHLNGGRESKIDVLVMENLLYGRKIMRLYDLKGSSRSRYNADSSGSNKVLLDQNLIEAMPTSPIFVGNKAKQMLERAVWNDTSFLASVDVMDYSLLVGVDAQTHQLVLGIIDFMRQYTWDKHLETWVKSSGFLGGSKNSLPTVLSPQQYGKRFRNAMAAYFLMLPEQCSSTTIIPTRSQSDFGGETTQQFSPG